MKYVKRAELVKQVQVLEDKLAIANEPVATPKPKIKYVSDTKEIKRLEEIIAQRGAAVNDGIESIHQAKRSINKLTGTNQVLDQRIHNRDVVMANYRKVIKKYKDLGFWGKVGMAFKSQLDVDVFFIAHD